MTTAMPVSSSGLPSCVPVRTHDMGEGKDATVEMQAGWLKVSISMGKLDTPAHAWKLVRSQSALPHNCRIALHPETHEVRALAERAMYESSSADDAARDLCTVLQAALNSDQATPRPEQAASALPGSRELLDACIGAGWPAEERGGAVGIPLGPSAHHIEAVAAADTATGGVRVTVVLADVPADAVCRNAAALLLLIASDQVRLVRPFASGGRRNAQLGVEVSWPGDPAPESLAHGLAAIATTCRHFAREIRAVIASDVVAGHLLSVHGWPTPSHCAR